MVRAVKGTIHLQTTKLEVSGASLSPPLSVITEPPSSAITWHLASYSATRPINLGPPRMPAGAITTAHPAVGMLSPTNYTQPPRDPLMPVA